MTIIEIADELNALNAATTVPQKKKPVTTPVNGHTVLSDEEQLAMTCARVVAALNLISHGVDTAALVASVKAFEHSYEGEAIQ